MLRLPGHLYKWHWHWDISTVDLLNTNEWWELQWWDQLRSVAKKAANNVMHLKNVFLTIWATEKQWGDGVILLTTHLRTFVWQRRIETHQSLLTVFTANNGWHSLTDKGPITSRRMANSHLLIHQYLIRGRLRKQISSESFFYKGNLIHQK